MEQLLERQTRQTSEGNPWQRDITSEGQKTDVRYRLTAEGEIRRRSSVTAGDHSLIMRHCVHRSIVERRVVIEHQETSLGRRRRRVEVEAGTVGEPNTGRPTGGQVSGRGNHSAAWNVAVRVFDPRRIALNCVQPATTEPQHHTVEMHASAARKVHLVSQA